MLIGMRGACVIGDVVYFSLMHANGLCRINLSDNSIEYVSVIPNELPYGVLLYDDLQRYGDKLVLSPLNAKTVAIYDLHSGSFKNVKYDREKYKSVCNYSNEFLFYNACVLNNIALFFPGKYPAILSVDLTNMNIRFIDKWFNDIKDRYDPGSYLFRGDITIDDDMSIYAVSSYYRFVIKLIYGTDGNYEAKRIDYNPEERYTTIMYVNGCLYLTNNDKSTVDVYDQNWKMISRIHYHANVKDMGTDYIGSVLHEGKVYFIPYDSSYLLILDTKNMQLKEVIIDQCGDGPHYLQYWIFNSTLYCYKDFEIDTFDLYGNYLGKISMNVEDTFYIADMKEMVNQNITMWETEGYNLKSFSKML